MMAKGRPGFAACNQLFGFSGRPELRSPLRIVNLDPASWTPDGQDGI